MPLPVAVNLVEEAAGLTPELFNMPNQATLDTFVTRFSLRADAWMQGHMGGNYNLLTPAWAPVLQEEGQIYLTLERLTAHLKSLKTMGTHGFYISEDAAAYQVLIETDWGKLALQALDLWVTVEQIGESRAFALPVFTITSTIHPNTDAPLD